MGFDLNRRFIEADRISDTLDGGRRGMI
jgi:hypothetical protein